MRYSATINADETVTVHDVPLFSEVVDPRGKSVEVYGRARLERWLRTSQQRAKEGYFGPTHVGHNGVAAKPSQPAGTWAPRRIGELVLDGAPRATLFVDLTVTKDVASRLQSGELPYVSAELKEDLSEIRSVALLDRTEAPFMKYALLSIDLAPTGATVKFADRVHFAERPDIASMSLGEICEQFGVSHETAREMQRKAAGKDDKVLEPERRRRANAHAMDFAEKAPKTTCATCGQQITTVRGQVGSHLRDISGQRVGCPGSGRPINQNNQDTEGHMADEKKPEDEKAPAPKMADEDKKADAAPKMADAAGESSALMDLLQKIAEKLGIMGGEPEAEEAPAEEATGSPVELMHADKARGARAVSADPVIAGMRGELAGLRRRLDDGERSTRFSDARGRLVRAGASPDDLKEFDALAKKGASHEPAALAFADSMVRVMPKRAPDAGPWTGELPPRGVVPTDGDAVKKFADRGPLVLDEARRFAGQHALLVAKGMTSNTLEDYLSANIDGLQPAGKK